jgi:hypothetical protein
MLGMRYVRFRSGRKAGGRAEALTPLRCICQYYWENKCC